MANLEQGLRAYWLSLLAVTTLVASRIYALKLPQAPTYPAVRFQLVAQMDRVRSHDRGDEGLVTMRIQVDSMAVEASGSDPFEKAKAVAATLQELSGFRGVIGSPALLHITKAWLINVTDTYVPEEFRIVRRMQEYAVSYYE